MSYEWKRGGESVKVSFRVNDRPPPETSGLSVVGTDMVERFRSRYIGIVAAPGEPQTEAMRKAVFPANRMVEDALDALARHCRPPWRLSCYLMTRETVFSAYEVDYFRAKNLKLDPEELFQSLLLRCHHLEQRLSAEVRAREGLEQQLADIGEQVQWIAARRRRCAVVVDYPNFRQSVQAEAARLPLEQTTLTGAVEAIRWYAATWPREVVAVQVVDHFRPTELDFHRALEVHGYNFVAAPPDERVNTTDQVVRDEALRLAQRQDLRLQELFLFTGDGDFAPLVRTLRDEYGLKVFVAGFLGHVSQALTNLVPVIYLDHIVPLPPPRYWVELKAVELASESGPSPSPSASDSPSSAPPANP
ncbi:MAG: hypothetical protein G01um101431_46 [Parcubacteria group bacterium Gr01-1014_31]|nr:MAG: hypothetical protein G01um101431_46 [Parcubacteria group bacterium Gr01-1014_31]